MRIILPSKTMCAYFLTIIAALVLSHTEAQTFYVNTIANDVIANNTYQMNVNNCDSVKLYTCPPTNNISEVDEDIYTDMAIDTSGNLYYTSGWGSLYTRKLNDTNSCQFLGIFNNSNPVINALVADVNGNILAAGNQNSICTLYEYNVSTKTFSTIGNLPPGYFSSGDLFFYEGSLFLTCTNSDYTDAFIVQINISNPSQSCYFMDLGSLMPYGAFSIQYATYSDAYIISSVAVTQNNFASTLYKIDMLNKTISQPICVYPFQVYGAASVYGYSPSIADSTSCSTMPVKLLNFDYTLINKTVKLQWQTVNEINSDYFLIEKSEDGINFETIGRQAASDNSTTLKQYSFVDNDPFAVNYYRLKEVDLNGNYTYSNVLLVKVPQANSLTIIGNPVQNNLQIDINGQASQINYLSVFDFTGRRLKSFNAQNGLQNFDVSFLAAGTYVLQMITADGVVYDKTFVKSR